MPSVAGNLLLPAAGLATRIGGLPKFALPIGPDAVPLLRLHAEAATTVGVNVVVATRPEWKTLVDRILETTSATIVVLETETGSETILQCLRDLPSSALVGVSLPDTWISTLASDFKALYGALEERACTAVAPQVVAVTYETPAIHRGKLGTCVIRDGRITAIHDKQDVAGATQHWGVIGASADAWRSRLLASTPHAGFLLDSVLAEGRSVRCIESDGEYLDCGTIRGYSEALSESLLNA
jgi:hypothetical protein